MIENIKKFYNKFREQVAYVICGGLTTAVDFGVYTIFARYFLMTEAAAQTVSWFCSVLFAFFVSKLWVFQSHTKGKRNYFLEGIMFFLARSFSGAIQILGVYIFVTVLGYNDYLVKLLLSFFVVVSNYAFSKLIIFKDKSK